MTRPKKKKKSRFGLLLTLLLGVLAGLGADAWMQLNAPLPVGSGITVELEARQRLSSLSRQMEERGLFDSDRQRLYLVIYARLHGEAAQLKAGEYALEPGVSPLGLLTVLTSG